MLDFHPIHFFEGLADDCSIHTADSIIARPGGVTTSTLACCPELRIPGVLIWLTMELDEAKRALEVQLCTALILQAKCDAHAALGHCFHIKFVEVCLAEIWSNFGLYPCRLSMGTLVDLQRWKA